MYNETDKMAEMISREPDALQVISRFNIPLGIGEKTIQQVCEEFGVHTRTFLTIINFNKRLALIADDGEVKERIDLEELSLRTLMDYLSKAHSYLFDFSLPMLRKKLIDSLSSTEEGGLSAKEVLDNENGEGQQDEEEEIKELIVRFFDEWVEEIGTHMRHEDEDLFPYVESLLKGDRPKLENINKYEHQHSHVDDSHIASKLTELKNMIIRYYPARNENKEVGKTNNLLNSALYDIFQTEKELACHCAIEDNILLPAVRKLEQRELGLGDKKTEEHHEDVNELSEREKDVLIQVVNGLSNKEIADVLGISPHTVISHRKNIATKLNIHSTPGLTIYAIVNKLIKLK